jgi:hypothetical protein
MHFSCISSSVFSGGKEIPLLKKEKFSAMDE